MTLLERHFDTAFDAPDGIPKLRELILKLAMQGRLVPQNPGDRTASELLKDIEAERARMVKEGKVKTPKPLPPLTEKEETYTLPKGWKWVRFGDIAQHNSGKTLDKGRNTGKSRHYITTSNLYWGRFELANVRQMLIRDDELEKCTAKKNDLLICEGGEAGRAAVWSFDSDVCFQNHVHRARFYRGINPYFAYRFFEKLSATGEINQYRKGVGISNMSSKALASIAFPLAPISEQHGIVAKINELMDRCDALEKLRAERDNKRLTVHSAAITQLLSITHDDGYRKAKAFLADNFGELYSVKENVIELRRAILQLAVMGKLVPQNPNDEPGNLLIGSISDKKKLATEGKIKKSMSLCRIDINEVPFPLPPSWHWVRLGDIAETIDYGTSQKTGDDSSQVPVYRMGNIVDGKLINEGFKYLPPDMDDLPKLYLKHNDILFNRTNSYELVGKSAIYTGPDNHATFASYLIRVRLERALKAKYFGYAMNAPYFRSTQIEPEIVQQCGQANFNGSKLSHCLVPLPPLNEQDRLVHKIEQLMSLCDTLEESIDAAHRTRTRLLNALMAQE